MRCPRVSRFQLQCAAGSRASGPLGGDEAVPNRVSALIEDPEVDRISTSVPPRIPRLLIVALFNAFAIISALVLTACDPSSLSTAPPAACTASGAQCQLPEGPLGVCERSRCPPGETSPCFKCTPQH